MEIVAAAVRGPNELKKQPFNPHNMENFLAELFDEAITLELNIAEIYTLFRKGDPKDEPFWRQMALEERKHSALLNSCKDISMTLWQFPAELLPKSSRGLIESNRWLHSLIEKFTPSPPERSTAFQVAVDIERSTGEIHYQLAMTSPTSSKIMRIFQQLNNGDRDHLKRIMRYMQENGLST